MGRKTNCDKCINNEHTIEEHTRERKRKWYEETNYRDKLRMDKRIKRNSIRVFKSMYDKQMERDFSNVIYSLEV